MQLKNMKDDLQVKMFEKIIEPIWRQYDPEDKGLITLEDFKDLGKKALSKAGLADKINWNIFDMAIK